MRGSGSLERFRLCQILKLVSSSGPSTMEHDIFYSSNDFQHAEQPIHHESCPIVGHLHKRPLQLSSAYKVCLHWTTVPARRHPGWILRPPKKRLPVGH